jgi:hypothetical protein
MSAAELAFDALSELSALKHFPAEIVRGALSAALHRRGVTTVAGSRYAYAPEVEHLITEATSLVVAGLQEIGFAARGSAARAERERSGQ